MEVAPAYDHGKNPLIAWLWIFFDNDLAEITAIAAADLVHDFLSLLLSEVPPKLASLAETGMPTRDEL